MPDRLEWVRWSPGTEYFYDYWVLQLLDLHYGEDQWNPQKIVRLADPRLTEATIPSPTDQIFIWTVTEELWNMLSWNPRIHYKPGRHEGNFGYVRREVPYTGDLEKPTWDDLRDFEQDYQVYNFIYDPFNVDARGLPSRVLKGSRDALVSTPIEHGALDTTIDPGAGIKHMPAMTYITNRSGSAGIVHPPSVMRDGDGAPVTLWTEEESHHLLEGLAVKTNHVESARNIIHQRMTAAAAPMYDGRGGLAVGATKKAIRDAKAAALEVLSKMLETEVLDAAMLAEVAKIEDTTLLPSDFERAKKVLVGRLEAAATGHLANLKAAQGQQGVDLPASCNEQLEATQQVAKEKQLGQIEVERSLTITIAKAAYKRTVEKIDTVKSLGRPVFSKLVSTVTTDIVGNTVTFNGTEVTIRAKQPARILEVTPGNVSLSGLVIPDLKPTTPVPANANASLAFAVQANNTSMDVTLGVAGSDKAIFHLKARNLCGLVELTVILIPPATT